LLAKGSNQHCSKAEGDEVKILRKPPVYAYPRLSKADLLFIRIGGNGLGNLMFTWARCLATARQNNWQMIWPTWGSLKLKNWRVNPYDHRTYFDLFRPTDMYVTGWRKPKCLAQQHWISEAQALAHSPPPGSVVEFRGMEGMFTPFRGHHELVYRELMGIAQPQHLKAFSDSNSVPIAIHVRRGDFVQQGTHEATIKSHNSILPIEWYVEALQAVRSTVGMETAALVFSDGTDEELKQLLRLPSVSRADYGSGLGDMLGLSRSRLLIASGSTFSMWGSFLGQVPTIWHPGKLLQPLLLENPDREIEWAQGDVFPDWVKQVVREGPIH
jgi:hypothetical protein